MKIETTIKPRRDGTVSLTTPAGTALTFKADDDGRLVADVEREADAAFLLARDGFLPADEADFATAALLTNPQDLPPEDDDFVDDGNVVGETEDLDDDEPADLDAAPVEEPASVVAAEPAKPRVGRPKKQ